MHQRLESPYWALRLGFGVVPIAAGLDKFTNLLVDWTTYLSPLAKSALPVSPATFMGLVGIVEAIVGLVVLSRFTRWGAYVAGAWLTLVALQVAMAGHLDVCVRDLVMAVAAFTLARLDEAREGGLA